jgi:hypothetical protein
MLFNGILRPDDFALQLVHARQGLYDLAIEWLHTFRGVDDVTVELLHHVGGIQRGCRIGLHASRRLRDRERLGGIRIPEIGAALVFRKVEDRVFWRRWGGCWLLREGDSIAGRGRGWDRVRGLSLSQDHSGAQQK